MLFGREEFPERDFDMNSNITGNNNTIENEMNVVDVNNNSQAMPMGGMSNTFGSPIVEAVQEKCVHKTIMHEVPQE